MEQFLFLKEKYWRKKIMFDTQHVFSLTFNGKIAFELFIYDGMGINYYDKRNQYIIYTWTLNNYVIFIAFTVLKGFLLRVSTFRNILKWEQFEHFTILLNTLCTNGSNTNQMLIWTRIQIPFFWFMHFSMEKTNWSTWEYFHSANKNNCVLTL